MGRREGCQGRLIACRSDGSQPGDKIRAGDAQVWLARNGGRAEERFYAWKEGSDLGGAGDVEDLGEADESLECVAGIEGRGGVVDCGLPGC